MNGPIILGHECAGEVVKLGAGLDPKKWGVQPGDRVCIEPGYGCGKCLECRTGKYEHT